MRVLFIHHNFPGQYKHLAPALRRRGHTVAALGDAKNVGPPREQAGVRITSYKTPRGASAAAHHYLRHFEGQVRRGQAVARKLIDMRDAGFVPDVVCAHPGWGEGLFVRDVFPNARQLHYAEFFYNARGADVGFDPEFPSKLDDTFRVRIKNAALEQAGIEADRMVAPTAWQAQQWPDIFHNKIDVVHDGIDTERLSPRADTTLALPSTGAVLSRRHEVVTFVARNLEPYRGIHTFIRALPELQRRRPDAHVVIIGGEGVSYGSAPPPGKTYRQIFSQEVKDYVDWEKVNFLGKVSYTNFIAALQVSSAHVYLTYPFVLSWSALEAMALACPVIGSDTAPVREVIAHDKTGKLVDFFNPGALAATIDELLADPVKAQALGQRARDLVRKEFDLRSVCLPAHLRQIELLGGGG